MQTIKRLATTTFIIPCILMGFSSMAQAKDSPKIVHEKAEVAAINHQLYSLEVEKNKISQNKQAVTASHNLWPMLISHFQLSSQDNNQAVKEQINYWLRNKSSLENTLQNAAPYLYFVYEQTQKRHMPAEMALLPVIESNYQPGGYSTAGASGLWQMEQSTAASYGLNMNWWYDGRLDTVISTEAALNYLNGLHSSLHNWLLSLAAYDDGIGNINYAMRSSDNFWQLSLPHETEVYVPKLLALAYVIQHAKQYHITLPFIANAPAFVAFDLNSQIDVSEAAKFSGTSIAKIKQLNPQMLRWASNPNGVFTLLIPSSNAQEFKKNLNANIGKPHITWQYHQVQKGETLDSIAHIYHSSYELLKKVNNLTGNTLQPGQGVLIPIAIKQNYTKPFTVVASNKSTQALQNQIKSIEVTAKKKPVVLKPSFKATVMKIYQ